MRRHLLAAATLAAFAAPVPALAQDADEPAFDEREGAGLTEMADTLSDPERQRELAMMLRAMSEVLLDLPIAPLTDAVAEIAGEEAPLVEDGATLRSIAPEASRVPEEIEKNLPRAMEAAGTLAETLEVMLPQLRAMAERFSDTLPQRD